MVCLSMGHWEFARYQDIPETVELAEIRLDMNRYSINQVIAICQLPFKKIFTCRPGHFSDYQREQQLLTAIAAGADYVDVELEAEASCRKRIGSAARRNGCKLIVSYHNVEHTPDSDSLISIVEDCFHEGADIAKVACQVHSTSDTVRILSLYDGECPVSSNLVALGLGERGIITRVAAPFLGAPFTYASFERGKETGNGQLDWLTMIKIVNHIKINRRK